MNGFIQSPLDIVVAIHNIKLPREILNIITRFAVPIMYCSKCGHIILKECDKKTSLAWSVNYAFGIHSRILCLRCVPSMRDIYNQSKKMIYEMNS